MAQGRKYGTLPDLDSAPIVYATPDPSDEPTTARTTSPTSPASPSSYKDLDSASASEHGDEDPNDTASRVDRHKIRPSQARTRFRPSRVDARGVDFSDRISGGRKSYRVHSAQRRSRRRILDGEDGDIQDGEEAEETFEERVARLRRETEEVKAEMERREEGGEAGGVEGGLLELSKALQEIQESSRALNRKALAKGVNGTATEPEVAVAAAPPQPQPTDEDAQQVLSKASALEARLALLETSLGVPSTNAQANDEPTSILTSLSVLEGKLNLLNNTSLPAIESFSRQIKQLTTDADKLAESRRTARQSYEALVQQQRSSPSGQRSRPTSSHENARAGGAQPNGNVSATSIVEDAEQRARVESIYRTLQTIEQLNPTLPLVLERLKTLKGLHVDAASASEALSSVEKRQGQVAEDMKKWREALDGVEEAMNKTEQGTLENKGVVESWVKSLEERISKME